MKETRERMDCNDCVFYDAMEGACRKTGATDLYPDTSRCEEFKLSGAARELYGCDPDAEWEAMARVPVIITPEELAFAKENGLLASLWWNGDEGAFMVAQSLVLFEQYNKQKHVAEVEAGVRVWCPQETREGATVDASADGCFTIRKFARKGVRV